MASPAKEPKDFKIGDVIIQLGYEMTLLELVEIQERKGTSSKWYVYKVTSNACLPGDEKVCLHRFAQCP